MSKQASLSPRKSIQCLTFGGLEAEERRHGPECAKCEVQVGVVQNDNFSWFGYPEDTFPSCRSFFPGLHKASSRVFPILFTHL